MYSPGEIINILKANKPALSEKYPISELGLFGSFARGDFNAQSDIDILVDFNSKIDGYEYIRLAHEFEDIFKQKIDMVSIRSIKPQYLPFVDKHLGLI